MTEFPRYAELRDTGSGPKEVYLAAKETGLGLVDSIRMLRAVYGLTIADAKGVCVEADTGMTLDEYQESLLPDIDEVLKATRDD